EGECYRGGGGAGGLLGGVPRGPRRARGAAAGSARVPPGPGRRGALFPRAVAEVSL
ncbi:MAG: hypothetical protein AVDCRST_MAG78-1782, partial [uncultured Rubrobacteraceae bacterium]